MHFVKIVPALLGFLIGFASLAAAVEADSGSSDRAYWIKTLTRVSGPVLSALSRNQLKAAMPVSEKRRPYAHLEALGRTLAGIAPWLELGPDDSPEGRERAKYIDLAVRALTNAVDPESPDCVNFSSGKQPLVDSAYLSHALLRASTQLWGNLGEETRRRVVAGLKRTRTIPPYESNWLLFSAMVEAALWKFTGECEIKPIEYAIRRHLEWYAGDGTYGDGPRFHWDYYNGYVIQPMLLDIMKVLEAKHHPLAKEYPLILTRARRYAVIQERLISPEGTYPVMGRTSAMRFGAFQLLSQVALMRELPAGLEPGAVRAGMTAVIRRIAEAPGMFDEKGWLRIGVVGSQPSIAEYYISTGSLYHCTVGLVALGLPPGDPFWTAPPAPWTQKRIWSGGDVPADHAIEE